MKAKTKKKIFNSQNQLFYKIDQESIDLEDLGKELIRAKKNNNEIIFPKKENLSPKECLKKLYFLSNLKIRKKYNCTPTKYENFIVDYLLNNADCHLVSIFKEKMLTDYVEEFLRRIYKISESKERIPKFSIYYKNYLQFFCKPTYNNFKFNDLIQNYGEKKAELYYKDHYQGGLSNDDEDNGFEESSSDETSNKDNEYEFNNNNNGEIFNKMVKEKLDNVTVMTTINSTGNNTINLNINNEKIEVFSENKAEVSNDTTINDLMEDIKLETKKIKNRKKEAIKNKFKNSYKKILNYSLKSQEKNKSHKNISIESKKKVSSKDFSKKNMLSKNRKENNKEKIVNNEKLINQKINSQLFKYNVESHKINKNNMNKMNQNKIQKILKKRYSKNIYNNIYNNNNYNFNYNKESNANLRNTSSNLKSPDNRQNKKNSISGLSGKKIKYRSRNNFGSLYKNITIGTNTTTNKTSNFQTTNINKNSLSNLAHLGNNVFNTMNFMQNGHHQRTNSQLIKKKTMEKNKNKLQGINFLQDKKTSSLKMLVTDSGNPVYINPAIKIKKNEKLKSKGSNINIDNKNIIINNNENKLNNKITVTTNNYFNNLNNRYNRNGFKKTFADSNDSLNVKINNANYSNFGNQMSANKLIYNNEESTTLNKNLLNNNYQTKSNGNLMQIALSLLIESNSPSKQINQNSKNTLNSKSNTSLNNNNLLKNNNIINQKNNRNSYNNLNASAHYNININNQINININNKVNNKINNFRGSKVKNKSNKKNININIGTQTKKNLSKKKTSINTNSNNKLINIPGLNNKIKIRTRNYNISLKNGLTQNFNSNYNVNNEKVIKGYHTKSVSNLTDLINHNKKLISLYKNMSKSKSKEKK